MGNSILGTAMTGLAAFQRSLETTSHNITNVNTEGYSRQKVELGTNIPQQVNDSFLGKGVSIKNITRHYDQFITTQLRSSTSAFGDVEKYDQLAIQVDNILADPTVGLSPAIKDFFNAVNEAANDPASIPARQVLLSESNILTSRFETMNSRLVEIRDQVNDDITVMTDEISAFAQTIADLNARIADEQGKTSGDQLPNDLLDQRDHVLNQLSELVDVSVVPSNNLMISVFMGKGQILVLDTVANEVISQPSEFDRFKMEVAIKSPSGTIEQVTEQVSGGALAGTLRFRNEILDPAQQRLGGVAASVAMEFNTIHTAGFDLQGDAGELFFSGQGLGDESIPVFANPANPGNGAIHVLFDENNISDIDFSDYQLDVSVGPTYQLTRLSDNTRITLTESLPTVTVPPTPIELVATEPDKMPGIRIIPTDLEAGESFLIRPTYAMASSVSTGVEDAEKLALATNEATDSDGNSYLISGPLPGDNRNALLLAGLENKLGMLGGTSSFNDGYSLIVSEVGVLSSAAKVASAAQETLLNNAKESWSNISGVNLDEEAANLIKFQQSYQAAAQMVSVSNSLFDTLLGAVN